ncbi:MAG: hypothetical protein ACRD30_00915 [Bryobacteraceae bacterium]
MRLLAIVALAISCHAAILDRIAVTVGKRVITESDLIADIRLSAFLDRAPVDVSGEQRRKSADRLVDQMLILQEAAGGRAALASEDDVARALAQVKAQYGGEGNYRAALARYEVSEQDVKAHLLAGLRAMRYTDLRFRPEVQLSEDEIQDFYESLAEQAREKRVPIASLKDSRQQVENLLTDRRTAQALDLWLGGQRREIQILYRDEVFK